MIITKSSWRDAMKTEIDKAYFKDLTRFINEQYDQNSVFPEKDLIFNSINQFEINDTKVVIIGQDPYHGKNQANGIAFSVNNDIPLPPSLKNIFKEVHSDTGLINTSGDLTPWAKQGVLLLNTTLTVENGKPLSHQKKGWEIFTDKLIETVSERCENLVFILWGSKAIAKTKLIDKSKHMILSAPHPSPLSVYRGFYGCRHFSKTNELLLSKNKTPINWGT